MTTFNEELARALGYEELRVTQSLIVVKAAVVGSNVVLRQDGWANFTEPASCTTFWYALEDSTVQDVCLSIAPGSHRLQPITQRYRKDESGKPEFVNLERPVVAQVKHASETTLPSILENGEYEYKRLEVTGGTLILMHGNLMHTSEANRSQHHIANFLFSSG